MLNKQTVNEKINLAVKAGRIARIPFFTAGYPTMDQFESILMELDQNGADIIQIGIPFSDPVADGPAAEEAARTAILSGVTLHVIMEKLKTVAPKIKAGLVLMGYYNPFLQYGLKKLAEDCKSAGVQGLLIPDLPIGESDELRAELNPLHIDLISFVSPNTPEARMKEYASAYSGFVYVIPDLGTIGKDLSIKQQAERTVALAKKIFNVPVAIGFAEKSQEQAEAMDIKPDAMVFGNELISYLSEGKSAASYMQSCFN